MIGTMARAVSVAVDAPRCLSSRSLAADQGSARCWPFGASRSAPRERKPPDDGRADKPCSAYGGAGDLFPALTWSDRPDMAGRGAERCEAAAGETAQPNMLTSNATTNATTIVKSMPTRKAVASPFLSSVNHCSNTSVRNCFTIYPPSPKACKSRT